MYRGYIEYRGMIYRGYIEIMKEKMETTIWALGIIPIIKWAPIVCGWIQIQMDYAVPQEIQGLNKLLTSDVRSSAGMEIAEY